MTEDPSGDSSRDSRRKRIPPSVIVIAGLYLAVGIAGLAVHFKALGAPDGIWVVVTEFLAIVCGVFLLRAQNWARWLALAWMAFHVFISYGAPLRLAAHGLFFAVIIWCLFRGAANRFFQATEAAA